MKVSRTSRLDSEYKREIANIINGPLRDHAPEITGLISVTSVSVASDLKNARVFVSIYTADAAEKKSSFAALRDNAGFIRHELAQVMRMRTVPALQFVLDDSLEYGAHMEELFSRIHRAEAEDGDPGEEE